MRKDQAKELLDRRGMEGLIADLADKNMDVRTMAADALGEIGDERAVKPLIAALNDTTDYPIFKEPLKVPCTPIDARGEAAIALGKIGGDAAITALKAVADTSNERGIYRGLSVIESVKRALSELGIGYHEEEEVSENLSGKTERSSEEIVKAADNLRIHGQLDEALKLAKQATDTDPSNGYAWMETGLIFVARRDVVSATRAFLKAVSVTPQLKGSEPGARLAVVYSSLGMMYELDDIRSSLASSGLELDPRAKREWEQLVSGVDRNSLRAAIVHK